MAMGTQALILSTIKLYDFPDIVLGVLTAFLSGTDSLGRLNKAVMLSFYHHWSINCKHDRRKLTVRLSKLQETFLDLRGCGSLFTCVGV